MTQRLATFYKRPYNAYVPAATFAAYVVDKGNGTVEYDFGAPLAANATAILSAQSISTAGETTTLLLNEIVAPFGRNLSIVASGASTALVTIYGRDYLGQPMAEQRNLNGTTAVPFQKAFKWIDRVVWAAGGSVTMNVGTGARLGLQFRTAQIDAEIVNSAVGTVGTLTVGDLTDPQTFTTADPRGLYTPNATLNGTNRVKVIARTDNFVNAAGRGGLYGIAHFAG